MKLTWSLLGGCAFPLLVACSPPPAPPVPPAAPPPAPLDVKVQGAFLDSRETPHPAVSQPAEAQPVEAQPAVSQPAVSQPAESAPTSEVPQGSPTGSPR